MQNLKYKNILPASNVDCYYGKKVKITELVEEGMVIQRSLQSSIPHKNAREDAKVAHKVSNGRESESSSAASN